MLNYFINKMSEEDNNYIQIEGEEEGEEDENQVGF